MLEINKIKEHRNEIINRLNKRGKDFTILIDESIKLDEERKILQHENDTIQSQQNALAKQIGEWMKIGEKTKADEAKTTVAQLKESGKNIQEKLDIVKEKIQNILVQIPNVPHELVPKGLSAEDNFIYKDCTNIPQLSEAALPHWDLIDKYNLIDFETGTRLTGSGFPIYKGKGARLQRALINYFLDKAIAAGYTELQPPHMVNSATAYGTGQLPDKEGQMYHVQIDDLYLIPTAEVPVTNILADKILEESVLPLKYTAYTPCFRREAGSYGKDVRGLNRLHQFDKVEIVQFAHPDKSYDILHEMLLHVENILQELELPYRILRLCGGDMGFTSAMTYDFEVYSAAQKRWLEVSSTSCFETFQSNRMKIRFRNADKQIKLLHTLNGSALALPRIVAALLENNQSEQGIKMPKALHSYLGFSLID
jgi:seryl-tRNA synthetase